MFLIVSHEHYIPKSSNYNRGVCDQSEVHAKHETNGTIENPNEVYKNLIRRIYNYYNKILTVDRHCHSVN